MAMSVVSEKKGENTNSFWRLVAQPLKAHMEAKNEGLENHVPFKGFVFRFHGSCRASNPIILLKQKKLLMEGILQPFREAVYPTIYDRLTYSKTVILAMNDNFR